MLARVVAVCVAVPEYPPASSSMAIFMCCDSVSLEVNVVVMRLRQRVSKSQDTPSVSTPIKFRGSRSGIKYSTKVLTDGADFPLSRDQQLPEFSFFPDMNDVKFFLIGGTF